MIVKKEGRKRIENVMNEYQEIYEQLIKARLELVKLEDKRDEIVEQITGLATQLDYSGISDYNKQELGEKIAQTLKSLGVGEEECV